MKTSKMKELRDGLSILLKYRNPRSGVSAHRDMIWAGTVDPADVTTADLERLELLGWKWGGEYWANRV